MIYTSGMFRVLIVVFSFGLAFGHPDAGPYPTMICGGPNEDPDMQSLSHSYWRYKSITWSLNPRAYDHNGNMTLTEMIHDLGQAAKFWAANCDLAINYSPFNTSADILVSFYKKFHNDKYPFDGPGQILAHAYYPGNGGAIHIDGDETWVSHAKIDKHRYNGTSLYSLAVHEFGHALGLSHNNNTRSVMMPYYRRLPYHYSISEEDLHDLQELYGKPKRWQYDGYEFPKPKVKLTPMHRHHRNLLPINRVTAKPLPTTTSPPSTTTIPTTTTTTTVKSLPRPTITVEFTPAKRVANPDGEHTKHVLLYGDVIAFNCMYTWRYIHTNDSELQVTDIENINSVYNFGGEYVNSLDHVYVSYDSKLVMFTGMKMWKFDGRRLAHGYPKRLHRVGFFEPLPRGTRFIPDKQRRVTYIVTPNNKFYEFNELTDQLGPMASVGLPFNC